VPPRPPNAENANLKSPAVCQDRVPGLPVGDSESVGWPLDPGALGPPGGEWTSESTGKSGGRRRLALSFSRALPRDKATLQVYISMHV
jgi:hypothetical protein